MLPKACIVIPTYNEAGSIEKTIRDLESVFKSIHAFDMSILVFDSASTDKTVEIVNQLKNEYPNIQLLGEAQKSGLGSAYIQAMQYAMNELNAEYIFEYDADGSHQPQFIPKMLDMLQKGFDVVVGSRYARGGSIAVNWPWHRCFISTAGNMIARIVLTKKYQDFTSGFRVSSSEYLKKIDLPNLLSKQYAYKMHLFWALHQAGAKIAECPIEFIDRENGYSKFPKNNISESLKVIFILRWRAWFKKR